MDGLTIKKVMTDYLKYFVQLALKRLQVHDKLIKNEYFQEFVNEEFIEEDIKTICYCLVCPTDRQEFMKDCFIEAGIIEESKAEHRLSFVIKAVAVAHFHLSLDRNETNIQNDQDYCVVDVGIISTGIAKFHAASTESLSTITAISDDITQGSLNLGVKFKAHLIENMTDLNLDISLIDRFVQTFSENIKYAYHMNTPTKTAISQKDIAGHLIKFTYEDLNKIVLKPFVENIAELVLKADETQGQCRMFISENYGIKLYFIENLIARDKGELKHYHSILKDSFLWASSGAVSSKISTYKSQTPFYLNDTYQYPFSDKILSLPKAVLGEHNDDDNENDTYDFIVGIDFGNSLSGCSYVQLKDRKGRPVDTKEIKIIKEDWPGMIFSGFPTTLMYDKKMKPKFWGEEARLKSKLHKDLNLLRNFKLFLSPESSEKFNGHTGYLEELKKRGQFTDGTPKNEVDVVRIIADYLTFFKKHVIEYIATKEMDEFFGFFNRSKLLKKYKIRYVITVPALWNSLARNVMAQAAVEATIIKKDAIDQLLMISEPEAAALFCMKRRTEYFEKEDEKLNDTNFIVCDAGGGTVDLATFNLQLNKEEGNKPTTKPTICQIGDGIGDTCGSTRLDLGFKNYLFKFYESFGVDIYKENLPLDDVMHNFVTELKDAENEEPRYERANFFDPVVDRILYLIDDQLNQAKNGGRKINAILMVGGFSQSRYLQQRIKDRYKGVCHVKIPSDGATSISYGAVAYALNPRMVSRKTIGTFLGLKAQTPFIERLTDPDQRKVKSPIRDESFRKDRLEYFEDIQRQVSGKDVYVLYPNAAVIAIFACDSKDVNNKYLYKSHAKILEAKIIMPYMIGIDGRLIHFTVSLQKRDDEVSVTIECQDELINAAVRKISKNQRSSLKIKLNGSLNVAISKRPLVSYYLEDYGSMLNDRRFL
ncbi:hypothetical protein INT47_012738 [Mucor saturninus]|uniref:Heat shock protein 70 n=1 Tax=Mucor saturninus TaxID=64648 RepID=A0A8H7R570_9FUNG|nr:hypothetical protein INT47_012738 [Mucor saturninus]